MILLLKKLFIEMNKRIKVSFILLDSLEYYYDSKTLKVYSISFPHKLIGHINKDTFELIKQ